MTKLTVLGAGAKSICVSDSMAILQSESFSELQSGDITVFLICVCGKIRDVVLKDELLRRELGEG